MDCGYCVVDGLGEVASVVPLSDGADMGVVVQKGRSGGGADERQDWVSHRSGSWPRRWRAADGPGEIRVDRATGREVCTVCLIWDARRECGGLHVIGANLEKGGLGEALAGAGVTTETVLGFADEMRVGLRGMVRSWGRRGVKRLQLVYEWRYLFCVVDGRSFVEPRF